MRPESNSRKIAQGLNGSRLSKLQSLVCLLQEMKQSKVSARQDAPEDTDLIPVGYITPPRASASQPEVHSCIAVSEGYTAVLFITY